MCAVCDVHMSRVQWQCVITVSRAAGASSVVVMLVTGYAPVALAPSDAVAHWIDGFDCTPLSVLRE